MDGGPDEPWSAQPWPPEPTTPRGLPESQLFLDDWENAPADRPVPPEVREALENRVDRRRFEAYASARMRQLHSLIPEPDDPDEVKPCLAVGVVIDATGQREIWIATSGVSHFPEELEAYLHPKEMVGEFVGFGLDAEQRIVATMERIRWHDHKRRERGLPAKRDGIRLESVASAYQVCWRKCQPALRRERTRPLTPLATRPANEPEPEPPLAYGPPPAPQQLGPRPNQDPNRGPTR